MWRGDKADRVYRLDEAKPGILGRIFSCQLDQGLVEHGLQD